MWSGLSEWESLGVIGLDHFLVWRVADLRANPPKPNDAVDAKVSTTFGFHGCRGVGVLQAAHDA